MAFGIGTNPPQADAGNVRGTQRRIACECWFTSTGRIMPLMLKRYAGVPSIEYDCTLTLRGKSVRAWLIYYQSENRWVVNFR